MGKVGLACRLGLLFMAALAVAMSLNYWYTTVYPLDRDVHVHLDYARKLTDARAIAYELDMAVQGLERYHGNPRWLFPTAVTDFDYIREVLKSQAAMALRMAEEPYTNYAYQRYVENVIRTVGGLKDNVAAAQFWLWLSPQNVILAVVWLAAVVALHILKWIAD
jgi:hypothetical protein